MIGRFISDAPNYLRVKPSVAETAIAVARGIGGCELDASVNAADDIERENSF